MVLKRIRDLVMATVNEGLDQMEDPIVMINQYLRDMENELEVAHQSIIRHKSLTQSFKLQGQEASKLSEKRYKQAQLALDAGHEELAKKALYEKKHFEERKTYYNELEEKAAAQIQELLETVSRLQEKYEELRDRKVALVARANVAKTKNTIQSTLQHADHPHSLKNFERLEQRIYEMEMKAEHSGHSFVGAKGDPLEALESNEAINAALQALKEEREQKSLSLDKEGGQKEAL